MEYDEEIRQPEMKVMPVHFALILMTMLATILGVTTYLNYKQVQSLTTELNQAMQEMTALRNDLNAKTNELEDLKEMKALREFLLPNVLDAAK